MTIKPKFIIAKLLAAMVVALLFCAVYMFGFRAYMQGFTGGLDIGSAAQTIFQARQQLGVVITPAGYVLLGLSLFAAILGALAIAIILGILAEDVKSVHAAVTPLMVLVLIPYFVTMMLDVQSLSPALKWLIHAIPFSHAFLAGQNLILDNLGLVIGGIIYQSIIFFIFVYIAAKIFSGDKVLTMQLRLGKRKRGIVSKSNIN